ncbi:MAG TPA: hypothetical protein VI386_06625 [Candidatus Sulfotelmatobacter sp.]
MRILIVVVSVSLGAFSLLVLATTVSHHEGWYAALIPLSVLVAILLAKPRSVLLDHKGIRQERWITRDREIAWHEIAWVARGRNTNTTYVKSKNGGRPISFSPPLVGRSRFEREVRAHCREFEDFDED